ncbi:hypothetical protein SAMN05660479_00261 [Microbulbifer thermotolerans]|uniref:hypothetical protein n=1 Tax=Microbulbifer thermotolerans TaxID=252514 RepID=UPI0008F18F7C|nr:hypothetical protein [Microbulbifer thermotolerans]MCX2793863.1 hypothetical protein [Microbulbifer thermotolerans]MCX2834309.1 hypothetical protein [Microbulbifer thermotolerans]WKT61630.1 hypothetical protein Q2E61_05430 [Microbulbifer thermotolerans]SFB70649.1 hypothetical protein SAMN05660479_00261 [Microbulbifer thermotolerans]
MKSVKIFIPYTLLLLLVLYSFAAVFGLQYVWDDISLFVDSPALRAPENIIDSISQPILPGTSYFRPLPLLTFMAEFLLVDVDATLSHTINLIFHLATTLIIALCVWTLMRNLPQRSRVVVSLLGGAFYGLHPAMVEPVSWVAGRFDLMAAFFSSIALYAAISLSGIWRMVVVCAAFFLGALSKEMVATLPAIIILALWIANNPNGFSYMQLGKFAYSYKNLCAALVATGVVYLIVRGAGINGSIYHTDDVRSAYSFIDQLTYIGNTILFYLKMTVWPFSDINPMHRFPVVFSAAEYVGGAVGWVIAGILIFFKGQLYKRYKAYVLAYLISLLPVLNIIPLTIGENIGHERFLAVPLLLYALLISRILSDLITKYADKKNVVILFAGSLLCLCVINVKVTVPLWSNNIILWKWAFDKNPSDPYVQFSLISAAVRKGQLDLAQETVNSIVDMGSIPNNVKVAVSYLEVRKHNFNEAINLIENYLSESRMLLPHEVLSDEELASGDYSLGVDSRYLSMWSVRSAYGVLAESRIGLKQFAQAKKDAEVMLFYQPSYPPAHLLHALSLYGLGLVEEADNAFRRAEELIIDDSVAELYEIRRQFFSQLCEPDSENPSCSSEIVDASMKKEG